MWNQPVNRFEVFVFRRDKFRDSADLPDGFSFEPDPTKEAERNLLAAEFPQWEIAYRREFPGGESAVALAVRAADELAALIYLSPENEFDAPGYGQIHYPVVAHKYRGQGIYAPLLTSLLRIAEKENRPGLILVSDREGMAPIYQRWGADFVGSYPRAGRIRRRLNKLFDPTRKIREEILAGDPSGAEPVTGHNGGQ